MLLPPFQLFAEHLRLLCLFVGVASFDALAVVVVWQRAPCAGIIFQTPSLAVVMLALATLNHFPSHLFKMFSSLCSSATLRISAELLSPGCRIDSK